MKTQLTQINETIKFGQLFAELDFDVLSKEKMPDGSDAVFINAVTHDGVEIEIKMNRARLADADVNRALRALAVL